MMEVLRVVMTSMMPSWKDGLLERMVGMLLTQLREIKKKENETMKEFNDRFRKLVDNVPKKIRPSKDALLLHYTNAYDGHFGLMLRIHTRLG